MLDDDGKWLTFQQLAALRGTSKRAAVMLVRRHKWRRERNNEGHTIALVPATWADPASPSDEANVSEHVASNGASYAVVVLEQALDTLREAHSRELVVLREAHGAQVALLQGELVAAREAVEQAEGRAHSALQAVARAEQDREAAEAAAQELRKEIAAKRARGRWTRILAAWKGE